MSNDYRQIPFISHPFPSRSLKLLFCDRPRYTRASCQTSRPWAQPLTPTWRLGEKRHGVDPAVALIPANLHSTGRLGS